MTRFAPAVVGAALVLVACAPVTTSEAVVGSDHDLFTPCAPSVEVVNCGGEADATAKAACLDSRRAAYRHLHSPKMRRSWLIANGCPAATVDAPPPATREAPVAAAPPAPAAAPPPSPPPSPPARASSAPPPPAPPPPAPSPPAPSPPAPPPPALTVARASEPVAKSTAGPGLPAGAFSDRDRAETRAQKLRDIISSHRPEMKSCVDRQLKLAPDLQAEGTLVIDVEKDGTVPSAELLGVDLSGTPLETCLRMAATRWRFPASAHAYKISAPVKVWGSEGGR